MTTPLFAVDFDLGDARPSAREIVAAAAARGAAFLACDVVEGDDARPEAQIDGRTLKGLARLADEARRRRIGLFLRVSDTLAVHGLAEALGVAKGETPSGLRDRLLVVVDGERIGKRLRAVARELPSALELPASPRGLARFTSANFQRATADADDLVVPWARPDAERLIAKLAPILGKRGASVWTSGVPADEFERAAATPVRGLVVATPFGDVGG